MFELEKTGKMKKFKLSQQGVVTMKRLILVAVTLMIGVLTIMPANAACTLDPNPVLNLTGTWAFKTDGISFWGGSIAGTFTASQFGSSGRTGPNQGNLDILASSNLSGPNGNLGVYGASAYI